MVFKAASCFKVNRLYRVETMSPRLNMIISYSLSVAQPIFVFVKEEQKQSRRKRKRHDKSLAVKKKKIVVGP